MAWPPSVPSALQSAAAALQTLGAASHHLPQPSSSLCVILLYHIHSNTPNPFPGVGGLASLGPLGFAIRRRRPPDPRRRIPAPPPALLFPMRHFALPWLQDAPIFITTLYSDITSLKKKKIEGGDIEMMSRRLKVFEFSHKWVNPRKVKPCPCCFSKLVLEESKPCQPCDHGGPVSGVKRSAEAAALASIKDWGIRDVNEFLVSIDLGQLSNVFRNNAVDGPFLATLSTQDLVSELGCSNLQARKILSRVPSVET